MAHASGRRGRDWSMRGLYAGVILLTAAIFAADLTLPLGPSLAIAYCGVVLLAVASRNEAFVLSVAGVCSALTVAAGAAKPGTVAPPEWMSYAGRALALGMIWLVAVLGMQRRKAQSDLGSSEGRLQAIVETAVDAIITIDERGRILTFNRAAERIFGYTADEVTGKNVRLLMPPPYRQEHDGYLARYLETGERRIIGIGREVTGQRKDGSTFPLDLAVSETVLDDGRIFTGIVRDITERKRVEEVQAKLAAIVESSDDAIISKTLEGIIVTWNRGAERIFGYAANEVVGRPITVLIPAERQTEEPRILERLRRGESVDHFETVRIAKDGRSLDVSLTISPVRDSTGRIVGASKIVRDITEKKAVERRLQESEGRLRAIVETAVDAIITIDEQGHILTFNQAAERTFGYTTDEVVGKNVKMLMPSPYREEHDTYLDRYLMTGEKRIIGIGREVVGQRKDGSTFPLDLAVSETALDGRRIFTGIIRDITERKQAEERLHKLVTDLARSNAELEHFAFAIAHDLRTPLMSINGCAQLLMQTCSPVTKDNQDSQEAVEYIQGAIRHMDRLLRHLLDYSRVGQGGLKVEPSSCEAALERAVTNLRAQIEQSGAAITHDPLPLVMADDALLPQVFQNLIENGIKYCDERPARIHIFSRKTNAEWIISVRDSGIGIPEAYQSQIFKPFHRLYGDEKKYEGTGIGLAVCKKIVEQHGGRLWVESRPGQGATFSFSLQAPKPEDIRVNPENEEQAMPDWAAVNESKGKGRDQRESG